MSTGTYGKRKYFKIIILLGGKWMGDKMHVYGFNRNRLKTAISV